MILSSASAIAMNAQDYENECKDAQSMLHESKGKCEELKKQLI
jgi:hypothetical protein